MATHERRLAVILLAALINIISMSKNRFFFFETRWLLSFFDETYFISEPQNLLLKKTHTFLGTKTDNKSVWYFHVSPLQQKKNQNILKLNLKTFKIKSKLIFFNHFYEKFKIPKKL